MCVAVLAVGCGETAQDLVELPVHGAGTGETSFTSDGGWLVTLERADVALGPIYFCATPFADLDVCPRAEAELLVASSVDALDASPQMLGMAQGITATTRSSMLDYGIHWRLTAPEPEALAGSVDGHSAVFVVRAEREGRTLRVELALDIAPRAAGANAVIGAPTGGHAITGREALVIRLDPVAWWRSVDFEALAAEDLDGDGVVVPERGGRTHDTIVIAMISGRLPVFEWSE